MTVDTSPALQGSGKIPDRSDAAPPVAAVPVPAHGPNHRPTRRAAGSESSPVPVPRQHPRVGGNVGDLVGQAAAAFQDYRDGVPGGIDRLVRLITPLLWHTARQCGLSQTEAEDSVQQTFLALIRGGGSISDPLAVVRWLTVTLRRQAWRDRAVVARRSGTEPTDDDLPREQSAEAAAMLTDDQRRLWAHVSALPERCRRLLAVIAFAPRPDYASIAEEMGMPVGSIGPTRGRCLDKLRTRLHGEEWS